MRNPYIVGIDWNIFDAGLLSEAELCQKVGGNTGNLAFAYAISKQLGCLRSTSVRWGGIQPHLKEDLQRVGVFAMANIIGPHVDLQALANEYREVPHPLVALGVGAQAAVGQKDIVIPKGTIKFLEVLESNRNGSHPNIGVRGHFTKQVLENHGFGHISEVLGCPSLFINTVPDLGMVISANAHRSEITNIGVCAGNYRWTHLRSIEESLVSLVDKHEGVYIVQSPSEMIYLSSDNFCDIDHHQLLAMKEFVHPSLDDAQFIEWCRTKVVCYFSASEWMRQIKKKQFIIGCRIHGVMLGLQAGIPGICVTHDSRTLELCQLMMVPYIEANKFPKAPSLDELLNIFVKAFDPEAFDSNRRFLKDKYCAFANNNQMPLKDI